MRKIFYFNLILLGSLLAVLDAQAQMFFDDNAIADNSAGNDFDLNFTVPGGDQRLLIATIGTDDMTNTPTVTFNGLTLTSAAEDDDDFNNTYDARVLVYYVVLGDGPQISSSIAVTGLTSSYTVGGMTFQGIDQTNPKKQVIQAGVPEENIFFGHQVSATIENVTTGSLVFAFFGEDNVKQFDWGGNYTAESPHATDAGLDGDGYYLASYNLNASAGTYNFIYQINNSGQSCAGVLVEFARAADAMPQAICDAENINATPSYYLNFLQDEQISNGSVAPESVNLAASDQLTASATIEAYSSGVKPAVAFQAKNAITLEVGFHAVVGSDFIAKIRDCTELAPEFNSETPAESRIASLDNTPGIVNTELSVYPNPASYTTSIKLDLQESGALSLQLLNQSGQIVKKVAEHHHQDKGTYHYQLNTGDFTPGFYLVQMQNGKNRITKKLIIQ